MLATSFFRENWPRCQPTFERVKSKLPPLDPLWICPWLCIKRLINSVICFSWEKVCKNINSSLHSPDMCQRSNTLLVRHTHTHTYSFNTEFSFSTVLFTQSTQDKSMWITIFITAFTYFLKLHLHTEHHINGETNYFLIWSVSIALSSSETALLVADWCIVNMYSFVLLSFCVWGYLVKNGEQISNCVRTVSVMCISYLL